MDITKFNCSVGSLSAPSGMIYHTFTPKTLPVEISYDDELVALLSEASMKLGQLEGAGYLLKNPHLLIRPYMKKEAVLSSKIEGTMSSLSDVFLYEAKEKNDGEPENKKSNDVKEVINYVHAMEYGIDQIKTRDIDLSLLLDLHRILLGGVRGESKDPGSLRRIQNWIGRPGCDILDATFVPTEPSKIEPLLENLFVYLPGNGKSSLVKMGLAHYQFEAIHPFRDGNGRIGRLLITLSLIKQGVLSLPLLYLSAYFEKNREAYYASLLDVSQNGNYEGWLKFFLKGVIIQSGDAVVRIRRLMAYHEECRQLVKRETNSTNALLAMDNLFVNPFTTIPHTAKLLSKPYPTARNAIENLQKLGIVEEVSGQKRGKVYLAKRIINSIEG